MLKLLRTHDEGATVRLYFGVSTEAVSDAVKYEELARVVTLLEQGGHTKQITAPRNFGESDWIEVALTEQSITILNDSTLDIDDGPS